MCSFTDSPVATLSPIELKTGKNLATLFCKKEGGFRQKFGSLTPCGGRFFANKKDGLGHGLGPGTIVQRCP
jgi:hypothetical protein